MKRIAIAALVALAAVACGAPPAPPARPVSAPLPAPKVVPGSLEARTLLGELPQAAQRSGAGPVAVVVSGPMAENERIGAFVEVPTDACLLVYGRASTSLSDIDLAAFSDDGSPVAVDEGPDPKPAFLICPPHPDRVYVVVHAASGEGLAVVAAQLVPRESAKAVAVAVGARGALGGAQKSPEAWPGLDDLVRAHRAKIGGSWEEQRRVAVAVDARAVSSVAFSVDENGCTDALVVPDEDVALLDVDVLDAEGRLVARAKETTTTRSVTVCSSMPLAGSVQVRPHVGRGLAAVVVSKAKGDGARELALRPEVAWATPAKPLESTRAAREAALVRAGYTPPRKAHSGQLQLGRRATVPVELEPSGCTRVDVVAGAPLALVEAAIWDDSGALLGSSDGTDGATTFACGKGKARVDLGTRGRPGPYAVLVRPERWRDPAFASRPLAASRMLDRAATGPSALLEGDAVAARSATLDAAHQFVHNTSIRAGRCVVVAAGAEGEGTGLELRLFDAVDGEELDRSHGQHAAAVRACAGDATRSVRVEARATAGKLEAVFGERSVPAR